MGLENLDAEDRETVTKLAEQLNVNENNLRDMQVLIENVVRRGEQIRQSMRMVGRLFSCKHNAILSSFKAIILCNGSNF